jgi:gliding motility-associated-like protein
MGMGLTVSIINNSKNGTAILNEDGTIVYTPFQNFTGNDTITYQICAKGNPFLCEKAQVIITIFPTRDLFEIYNLVTPDGDGNNDYWYIKGIEAYADNQIFIFNRWGDKIREFQGYNNSDNRWDGTNAKNEMLPSGVYYYIIKIKDVQTYTGWVYIRSTKNN